jgi:hypothetical protein
MGNMCKEGKMKLIIKVCIGIMLLGILCTIPAAADIPTNIVDQYWIWYPMPDFIPDPVEPGYWDNPINHLGVTHPVWGINHTTLNINNVFNQDKVKNIWIEVKYVLPQTQMANLTITDPNNVIYEPVDKWISINGQYLTWQWQLPWQPDLETVNFGTTDFYNLNNIELVEVATQCVPEPGCVLVLVTGVVGLAGLKLRRK